MNESLWSLRVSDLLSRTASSDPTPGGGSVAAISGALGVGLLQMAIAVTADTSLDQHAAQLEALRARIVAVADADVDDFEALMSAYRLPRASDEEAQRRRQAIEVAGIGATEGPLGLVGALLEAVDLSRALEPLVKPDVVSDVLAGRDLVVGAARAGVHTADINISQLERLSSARAGELRERRDDLARRLQATA